MRHPFIQTRDADKKYVGVIDIVLAGCISANPFFIEVYEGSWAQGVQISLN